MPCAFLAPSFSTYIHRFLPLHHPGIRYPFAHFDTASLHHGIPIVQ